MEFKALPKFKVISGIRFVLDAFGSYSPENLEFLPAKIPVKVRVPADCLPFLSPIRRAECETFMIVTLDAAHQIIQSHIVTKGLVNKSLCHPREVFRPAIVQMAVSILLAHNHPSGICDPSSDDLITTRRLCDAGKLLGIKVLDHLIVTENGFLSLKEKYPDYFC